MDEETIIRLARHGIQVVSQDPLGLTMNDGSVATGSLAEMLVNYVERTEEMALIIKEYFE